jgi:SAM-dependent methyltransferase
LQKEDFNYLFELEERLWWFVGMREITLALLEKYIDELPTDRMILDAGCGTGGMIDWLARFSGSGKVFGLDTSADALQFCRQRGQMNITRASATELPYANNVFDLATSFDVLVQIPGDSADIAALSEMHRVVRPNGLIFVRAAAYNWMRSGHDQALGSQRRYTLGELEGKITDAGFQLLRTTYANGFLLPLAVAHRLLLKRLNLTDGGSDVKPLPRGLNFLNGVFTNVLRAEASIFRRLPVRFPAGLSIICVARKI